MRFQLNFKSGKPVYLQLVEQVKSAAASGAVQPGEPLPSIRPLAEELRVNRNTIAKAYAELESQRIIETIAGKGCFVRAGSSPFRKDVRLKLVAEAMDDAVVQAHHLQDREIRVSPACGGAIRRVRRKTVSCRTSVMLMSTSSAVNRDQSFASFRTRWNSETERVLIDQVRLDPRRKASHLSKGQRTQLALITAVC